MSKEIERKFLVADHDAALKEANQKIKKICKIEQGYLVQNGLTIRVRIDSATSVGTLTIKGPKTGITCDEYEYRIPLVDAQELLEKYAICKLSKTRYVFKLGKELYELDAFHGDLEGRMLLEIELKNENDEFVKPKWLGKEVTSNKRYSNSKLAAAGWPT